MAATRIYTYRIPELSRILLDRLIQKGQLMPGRFDVEFDLDEQRLEMRVRKPEPSDLTSGHDAQHDDRGRWDEIENLYGKDRT